MNFILTEKGLTVFADGVPLSVVRSDQRWDAILEALRTDNERLLVELMQPATLINAFISDSGYLKIEGGTLKYRGVELPSESYFVQKIIRMRTEGNPIAPLAAFIERLMQNPSFRTRRELLQFLEYGDLPITSDGHFLAYKRVRANYTDCHSGTISNAVGVTVEMPRANVDDDSNNTCSSGLHFCSREYLKSFWGDHLVVLKISPADVVSIPVDYNNTKGRCCRYKVVSELEMTDAEKFAWTESVVDDFDQEDTDEWDEGSELTLEAGDAVKVTGGECFGRIGGIIDIDTNASEPTYVVELTGETQLHWFREDELERLV